MIFPYQELYHDGIFSLYSCDRVLVILIFRSRGGHMSGNEAKMSRHLKIEIAINLALVAVFLLGEWLLLEWAMNSLIDVAHGLDNIGAAFGIVFLFRIGRIILALMIMVANPIRILIRYRKEIKLLLPKWKRAVTRVLILVPMIFGLLIVFEEPISDLMYYVRNELGKTSPSAGKTSADFYKELSDRGLLYTTANEKAMFEMNAPYEGYSVLPYDYYTPSAMYAVNDDKFYDVNPEASGAVYSDFKIASESNPVEAPFYVYNAIVTQRSAEDDLHYEPLAWYSYNNNGKAGGPLFEDIFIECKILYINGNVYALIGVDQSFDVGYTGDKTFSTFLGECPYYVLISEKPEVTTYYEGKYYLNGAINTSDLEMRPNTNQEDWEYFDNYPVKTVERLDIDSINAVAKEIRDGILKDRLEEHWALKNVSP